MIAYNTVEIDFTQGCPTINTTYAGEQGEIQAVHLSIVPEEVMLSDDITSYFVLFATADGTESSRVYSKTEAPFDVALWEDITRDNIVQFQLVAQDVEGNVVMKSPVVELYLGESIDDTYIVTPGTSRDTLVNQVAEIKESQEDIESDITEIKESLYDIKSDITEIHAELPKKSNGYSFHFVADGDVYTLKDKQGADWGIRDILQLLGMSSNFSNYVEFYCYYGNDNRQVLLPNVSLKEVSPTNTKLSVSGEVDGKIVKFVHSGRGNTFTRQIVPIPTKTSDLTNDSGFITQSAIDAEATARETADTELSNAIDAEATTRASEDAELSELISAEATARESADTALSGRIMAIEDNAPIELAKDATHVADVISYSMLTTLLMNRGNRRLTWLSEPILRSRLFSNYVTIDVVQLNSSTDIYEIHRLSIGSSKTVTNNTIVATAVFEEDATKLIALPTKAELDAGFAEKQDTLVSGVNIKTINGQSILGSGNIEIQGGGGFEIDCTEPFELLQSDPVEDVENTLLDYAGEMIGGEET